MLGDDWTPAKFQHPRRNGTSMIHDRPDHCYSDLYDLINTARLYTNFVLPRWFPPEVPLPLTHHYLWYMYQEGLDRHGREIDNRSVMERIEYLQSEEGSYYSHPFLNFPTLHYQRHPEVAKNLKELQNQPDEDGFHTVQSKRHRRKQTPAQDQIKPHDATKKENYDRMSRLLREFILKKVQPDSPPSSCSSLSVQTTPDSDSPPSQSDSTIQDPDTTFPEINSSMISSQFKEGGQFKSTSGPISQVSESIDSMIADGLDDDGLGNVNSYSLQNLQPVSDHGVKVSECTISPCSTLENQDSDLQSKYESLNTLYKYIH
ncbi:hypothetical protein BKA69DRAFT_1082260 [Paraphysoderma sedebokerense]|nr:hypothetical protein BKA69DRAFT_1082260 [Paraphysoderma sedebokerense]